MWKRKALMRLWVALVAVMVVAGLMLGTSTAAAYSPEEKEGFDRLCSEAVIDVQIDTTPDGILDTPLTGITLEGPVVVKRTPGPEGPPAQIDTEIIQMELTGSTPIGPIKVRAGGELGLPPSTGAIVEQVPGTDWPADSFFDVFFELTGTPYGPLTNSPPEPCHVEAVITDPPGIPPYHIDYRSDEFVPLKDEDGIVRARVLVVRHTPRPCPSVPSMTGWGIIAAVVVVAGVAAIVLRRKLAYQAQ